MATYFLLNIKTKEVFAIKSLQKDLFVQEDGLEYSYSKVPTLPDKPSFLTEILYCFHTKVRI